jgi:hypothetical protein
VIKIRNLTWRLRLNFIFILVIGSLAGCQGNLDRLTHVKGKAELIVSYKVGAAAYQFSPDMAKVAFPFSKDNAGNRWGFINLEGSKRQYELFTDCACGVQGIRWLDDVFFVSDGRCSKCNLLVDSRDLTTTHLSGEVVEMPVEEELIARWKEANSLYYIPQFGGRSAWLLILDETAPYYYSLSLSKYDRENLLTELGDVLILIERTGHGNKTYSPDGTMYAEHSLTGLPLSIYSRNGELLAEAQSARSHATIGVHGWTPDNKGVYFHVYAPSFPYTPEPLFLLRLPEK